jgi:hypothetical protein
MSESPNTLVIHGSNVQKSGESLARRLREQSKQLIRFLPTYQDPSILQRSPSRFGQKIYALKARCSTTIPRLVPLLERCAFARVADWRLTICWRSNRHIKPEALRESITLGHFGGMTLRLSDESR